MDHLPINHERSFSPERKEHEPAIVVDFYFGKHENAGDVEKMKTLFQECDIFVPESFAYDEKEAERLQQLALGQAAPLPLEVTNSEMNRFDEYVYTMERLLYEQGRNKLIILFDLPANETPEDEQDQFETKIIIERLFELFVTDQFHHLVLSLQEEVNKDAALEERREEYIANNIIDLLLNEETREELYTKYQHLREKQSIRMLIQLGACHTGVYHRVQKALIPARPGVTVRRIFDQPNPYVHDSATIALRRRLFHKEWSHKEDNPSALNQIPFLREIRMMVLEMFEKNKTTIEDSELLKMFIDQTFVSPQLRKLTNNYVEAFRVGNDLTSSLTVNDMERISTQVNRWLQTRRKNKKITPETELSTEECALAQICVTQEIKEILQRKYKKHFPENREEFSSVLENIRQTYKKK